jgi:hypothetical protein
LDLMSDIIHLCLDSIQVYLNIVHLWLNPIQIYLNLIHLCLDLMFGFNSNSFSS